MKKLILCSLAGAIMAQIWGMISWMVLPWHNLDFKQFQNDEVVAEVFRQQLQGSGLYTIPNMDPEVHESEASAKAWQDRASKGPFVFISARPSGIPAGMGIPMAIGFLLNLFMAAILYWLLTQSSITCPYGRSIFVALAGGVGAIYPHMSNWNWWHFPLIYCLVGVIDLFITWGLAGFVMVKLSDKLSA